NIGEDLLPVIDKVHLVNTDNKVGYLKQRGYIGMTSGLLQYTLAGIYKDYCCICSTGPGHHITGVLYMSWGIGNNKLPFGSGKISISNVNSNTLFPFCPKSVCQ